MREESADSYFLLGLMLRYDGQTDRAEKFLAKAAALSTEDRSAIAGLTSPATEVPVSLVVGDEI